MSHLAKAAADHVVACRINHQIAHDAIGPLTRIIRGIERTIRVQPRDPAPGLPIDPVERARKKNAVSLIDDNPRRRLVERHRLEALIDRTIAREPNESVPRRTVSLIEP